MEKVDRIVTLIEHKYKVKARNKALKQKTTLSHLVREWIMTYIDKPSDEIKLAQLIKELKEINQKQEKKNARTKE